MRRNETTLFFRYPLHYRACRSDSVTGALKKIVGALKKQFDLHVQQFDLHPQKYDFHMQSIVIYGVELSTRSSATSNRTTKLDAVSHGVETCNLDAMNHDVDPQGPKLSLLRPRV
jgi:hypothetical protein